MFRKLAFIGLILTVLAAAGCTPARSIEPEPANNAGMANPASTHCIDNGGRLEMRTDASGGQYGVCIFPDNSECEEWAYFRNECQPGSGASAPQPAGQEENPAVQAVIALLAEQLGVSQDAVSLKSMYDETFGDSCLGLAGPDEMCAMVMTDGYIITLTVDGTDYTFHTNLDGTIVRQAQVLRINQ